MKNSSLDILAKRARKVGSLYRFDAGQESVGLDTMAEPSVDLTRMSATVVINTPTVDRQGDSLLPEGCDMEEYKRNPIVLWEHGAGPQGAMPVGKSEDEKGVFTVAMDQAALTATCFFSQTSELARQVFSLVAEKIIRGASVRARPIDYVQNAKGLLVKLWELEEWSWVAIPCNPDAVAKAVSDKAFMGKPLDAVLLKSLTRVAPKSPIQSTGWTPPQEAVMKTKAKSAVPPEDEKKPEDEVVEPKSDDVPPEEEMPEDEMVESAAEMLPGQIALTGLGEYYKGGVEALKAEIARQENTVVKEYMKAELDQLTAKCDECQGKLKEAYPDAKPEEPKEEEKPDSVKSLAAYFAKSNQARLRFLGLASGLGRVLADKGLSKSSRELVKKAHDAIVKTAADAKKASETVTPDAEKALAEAKKQFDTLAKSVKEISQLIPAPRK